MKTTRLTKLLLLLTLAPSCVTDDSPINDTNPQKIEQTKNTEEPKPADVSKNETSTETGKETLPETPMVNENCIAFNDKISQPPFWIESKKITMTRVLKTCVTPDGQAGYEKNNSFMAMAVPCTAGEGKIDIKGMYHDPDLVSFLLSNECPTTPRDLSQIKDLHQLLGLDETSKIVALNPLAVQYWEIPGLSEADVGFAVDLRTTIAKQKTWKNFVEGQSIPVHLYGRENAWVMGDQFYFVTGDIIKTGRSMFKLNVKKVEALTPEKLEQVKKRCESLQPKRECSKVF